MKIDEYKVLILVLMEDTLRDKKSYVRNNYNKS